MPKAKSAAVKTGHQTKEEAAARMEAEEQLRGEPAAGMDPPDYLNGDQVEIFQKVLALLLPTKILNSGDVYMVTNLAISIERKAVMDEMINEDPRLMSSSSFMASRERYEKSFLRCCSELCLSPAARAKMSLSALGSERDKSDPLMNAMKGGGSGD